MFRMATRDLIPTRPHDLADLPLGLRPAASPNADSPWRNAATCQNRGGAHDPFRPMRSPVRCPGGQPGRTTMRPGKLSITLAAGAATALALGGAWALRDGRAASPAREAAAVVRVRERHM